MTQLVRCNSILTELVVDGWSTGGNVNIATERDGMSLFDALCANTSLERFSSSASFTDKSGWFYEGLTKLLERNKTLNMFCLAHCHREDDEWPLYNSSQGWRLMQAMHQNRTLRHVSFDRISREWSTTFHLIAKVKLLPGSDDESGQAQRKNDSPMRGKMLHYLLEKVSGHPTVLFFYVRKFSDCFESP